MIQKIKTALLSFSALFILATPAVVPVAVSAASIQENVCRGADLNATTNENQAAPACTTGKDVGSFQGTLNRIVNIISIIVGIVAVIMIIYGGFRYITSGGNTEKVTSAKNTILYGIIGLIIVALAQVIVKFVLRETTSNT